MKKVLIVTYYWPPAGGAGVQRIAKFCKYLGARGWDPLVLTIKDGNYPNKDQSLEEDVKGVKKVYKVAAWEPHSIYNRLVGLPTVQAGPNEKPCRKGKIKEALCLVGEFIRLNFFIPDSRIGWLRSASQAAAEIIQREQPSLVFTTAPPFTVHLIGLRLKKRFMLPWVADFRDPWLENLHYNKRLRLGPVKWLNRFLELKVLEKADQLVCVGEHLKQILSSKISAPGRHKVSVITNGYDKDDICDLTGESERYYLSYFGSIYPQRFPEQFLTAVKESINSDSELASKLSLRIIGNVSPEVNNRLVDMLPAENLSIGSYIPHHEMLAILYQPQLLVLTIDNVPFNEHIITGKIFDYLPTGNPILGIGPVCGDAARIINQSNSGQMFAYGNIRGMMTFIVDGFRSWQNKTLNKGVRELPNFERQNLTSRLANIFDELVADNKLQ